MSEDLKALRHEVEGARRRFLSVVETFRPRLHSFCSKMVGSALEGEDLVQETFAHAYYKLPLLREERPMEPWLFKIAQNKCIDFLRQRRGVMASIEDVEDELAEPPRWCWRPGPTWSRRCEPS